MWHRRRLSYPRPGKQHRHKENKCLLVFGVPIYAVLQAGFAFRSGKHENHSTSSVPFSSGKHLPALKHETELCYEDHLISTDHQIRVQTEDKSLSGERSA